MRATGFNDITDSYKISSQAAPNPETPSWFSGSEISDRQLLASAKRAANGYTIDGLIRNGIDRFSDTHAGFRFVGNDKAVKYLTTRLIEASLIIGSSWEGTLSQLWHQVWETGTGVLLKRRGSVKKAYRAVYASKPHAISSVVVVPLTTLSDPKDIGAITLWTVSPSSSDWSPIDQGAVSLRDVLLNDDHLYDPKTSKRKTTLSTGRDLVVVTLKKAPGTHYGRGQSFPALEDVSSLRAVENSAISSYQKWSGPFIHHEVTGPGGPFVNYSQIQQDVNKVKFEYATMERNGALVTGPGHKASVHGGESQALRPDSYFTHFVKRAISSLANTPFELGFGEATTGAAEGSRELKTSRINFARAEFSREIERLLLWEILYEGGFNPYENEADRVFLEFKEVDQSVVIKYQAHLIDVYNKGGIDLSEFRQLSKIAGGMPNPELLFARMQAKAQSATFTSSANNSSSNVDSYSEPEEIARIMLDNFPADKEMIEIYLQLLKDRFGLSFTSEEIDNLNKCFSNTTDKDVMAGYLVELVTNRNV